MAERITIPLSDAAPVSIDPDAWPIVAEAEDHDGGAHRDQATRRSKLKVRQHKDGRRIVYGWTRSSYAGAPSPDAGWLVPEVTGAARAAFDPQGSPAGTAAADDRETIRAIRRTAGAIGAEGLVGPTIAALPARELV